jgi:nucleotide-binding universal stress UspA family protein
MPRFESVLVFTDGRPEAERAFAVGLRLAREAGKPLTVLHVTEPLAPLPQVDADMREALEADQEETLQSLCARGRREGVEVLRAAAAGRPFAEIIRQARAGGHDLVVKAARGRGLLGGPLLGSTALHLVRKCPVPVWLVAERPPPVPRRVMALLSADGDSTDRIALDRRVVETAASIARAADAELSVGAAWEAPGEALLARRTPQESLRRYVDGTLRQAEDTLAQVLEPFGAVINPARVHLVRGTPYVELVRLVEARRVDLAVIGTTPPGAAAGFLIREEAEEVVNRLEASIVAVKPDGFTSPLPG